MRRSSFLPLLIGLLALAGCTASDGVAGVDASPGGDDDAHSTSAPDPDVALDTRVENAPDLGDVHSTMAPDPDAAIDTRVATVSDLGVIADLASPTPWPSGKCISVDEVHARLLAGDANMLLVNVVDEEYYNLGFVAGSLKIPWDTLAGRLAELDRQRHIVIYCRKGVRSESAYTTLNEAGFPRVWVMEGGIERWTAAGYPTVAD